MSGCLGKTQLVLYIHETSLVDFLLGQKVRAWHQADMVRDSKDMVVGHAITIVANHSCIKLEDGYKIYVTCKEIIKPFVVG